MPLNLDPENETLIETKPPVDKIDGLFWIFCNDCAKCFICFNLCRGRKTEIV